MQTFLPYESYIESAKVLDYRRLGKQRVEVLQLLQATNRGEGAWYNHPARKMWDGHTNSLVLYGAAICREWISRGYKDTCLEKIEAFFNKDFSSDRPKWVGDEKFHASHRSNLLRKNPDYYAQFEWTEPNDLPYVWPSSSA